MATHLPLSDAPGGIPLRPSAMSGWSLGQGVGDSRIGPRKSAWNKLLQAWPGVRRLSRVFRRSKRQGVRRLSQPWLEAKFTCGMILV
jgi:hypothetical protein